MRLLVGTAAGRNSRFRPVRWLWLWGLVSIAGLTTASSRAHDLFSEYIQHQVVLSVSAKHLDVTVQLTFFEETSEHERQEMDANRDGRLGRSELEAYLEQLDLKLARAVSLRLAGRPLALISLRRPELDLLGAEVVARGHHRLTLFYFAPLPEGLEPGAECVVEDRLWPGARALGTLQVEGKDGCRIDVMPIRDPLFPPLRDGEARHFTASLGKLPTVTTENHRADSSADRSVNSTPSHP